MMSNKQLNDAEEGIVSLADALSITHKRVIDILEMGWEFDYGNYVPEELVEFIDEMRATFDAY